MSSKNLKSVVKIADALFQEAKTKMKNKIIKNLGLNNNIFNMLNFIFIDCNIIKTDKLTLINILTL